MNTKRFNNQIRMLEIVFQAVHAKYLAGYPVDRELSAHFRRNRQFGSKDRRFISGSIFGYYRWYGWLRSVDPGNISLALALGYVLDGNDINELIRFWLEALSSPGKRLDPDAIRNAVTLDKKAALFSELVTPVSVKDLNPELVGDWDLARIEAFQTRPSVWLRMEKSDPNSFFSFLKSKQIAFRVHQKNSKTIEILSPININESVDFRKGWVEVQDLSSQAISMICQPEAGSAWWDACAGSGGKSLHLSALLNRSGDVYATEINEGMFRELNRRVQKNKRYKNIHPLRWDGVTVPDFGRHLDGILVDAPCSCSGTWRRNPELRWRISHEQIDAFAKTQLALLQRCSSSVRENGVLVYATCSLFPEENEQVIDKFLDAHREFTVEGIQNPFTDEYSKAGLTIAPPETDGNGMFVAKLVKNR